MYAEQTATIYTTIPYINTTCYSFTRTPASVSIRLAVLKSDTSYRVLVVPSCHLLSHGARIKHQYRIPPETSTNYVSCHSTKFSCVRCYCYIRSYDDILRKSNHPEPRDIVLLLV